MRLCHSGELNCCGNICLSTFRVIGAAVKPRRRAEQRGNGFLLIDHHFGTELQHAALLCVFLDDLYALAGLDQFPVFFTRVRVVLFQRSETVIIAEHHRLTVFHQIEVVETDVGHRQHVGGGSAEQIEERTIFRNLVEKVANGPNSTTRLPSR